MSFGKAARWRASRAPLAIALPGALVAALLVTGLHSQEAKRDGARARYQPAAKLEQHEQMVADKRGVYGPADGGGSARIVEQPSPSPCCGTLARYVLEYAAGPLGVAVGGAVHFQVSPFWGWTTPHFQSDESDSAMGNTRVHCDAPGVAIECTTPGPQLMVVRIAGAPLPPNATITIEYGAPRRGAGFDPQAPTARVDDFAEGEESFYFWVDGDGDGSRKLIARQPTVDVRPGPAVDLIVTAPSEVAIGGSFELVLAFLDARANAAVDFTGEVALAGAGLELPATVEFAPEHRARRRVAARALEPGIHAVVATVHGVERRSNPILVTDVPRRVLWADLHGHSSLSDGTGTPDEYYEYARDVAALDVAVLTDHDHWGMRKLDQDPALWQRIRASTERFDDPGRFTTLLGYEWTSWLYGHRHVLYFESDGEVFSSVDDATMSPQGLWQALRERKAKALTVPHHPAGGPVPIDWSIPPDPDFEPVVEITSVHGTSEEPRGPRGIYSPVKGHFVRDALAKGYRLGFVGSGDTHNGHPGLGHLGQPCGGVAAILAAENTRESILEALRARTCYATTGPRILVWFRLGNARMGAIVPPPSGEPKADASAQSDAEPSAPPNAEPPYFGLVIGTAPIDRLELIKNGTVAMALEGGGSLQRSIEWLDPDRQPGDVVYLRAIQSDGHAAWASPIWTDAAR